MVSPRAVNILLVDDRAENLIALEAVLSQPGYNLVKAYSGREALSWLLRDEFAVVLLDAQMPEMDGFETAALIRKKNKTRSTPIIFLTAIYSDFTHIKRGYESGAVDYMSKPFDPDILRSKVAVFVDLYHKTRELSEKNEEILLKNAELEHRAKVIETECQRRIRAESIQEHYQSILNGLDHSIIWEADVEDMRFRFVSQRAEKLLGYPHKQWFEEKEFFFNRISPEDRDLVRFALRESIRTGEDQRCEHRMIAQDGKTYWFHTGIQYARKAKSGIPTLQGLSVDITPLKLSEEELRKSEAKYRKVIDANLIGHFFADLRTGKITDANDCFLQLIGYTRDELASGKVSWSEMTPQEFRELDLCGIQELRETGVCQPVEKEYIRRDGTRVSVMIGAAQLDPFTDECVCFVLDLSGRKTEEQEKIKSLRAREEMLEIVSHDLKNPLSAILMNAVLLFKKLPDQGMSGAVRKQVASIQSSAERMKSLIEDLLDLAKVEAGRLVVSPAPQDPAALLKEALELLKPIAEEKGIRLTSALTPTSQKVLCDHERILQVLSNILGNAVKFTPSGGSIHIEISSNEKEFTFCIKDTGSGISEEQLPRVFDRYWQAHLGNRQSVGLGLSITKGIIDAHHGKIWVESQVGKGTTFCFSLPAATAL